MTSSLAENWDLPKVSKQEIYETKTSIFNFKKDYSIKTTEDTILLPHSQQPIQLFNPQAIEKHRKKYKFVHIGLVQVGVKSLSHEVNDSSILLCLRDKRMLDFDSSILSVLESSLADGPAHFDYYPNIMLSLQDVNILDVLSLYIKFSNLEIQGTSFPFVLMYRVHYKCMPNPINPAAKKSSRTGETLFHQTKVRSPNIWRVATTTWRKSYFGRTVVRRTNYLENNNLKSIVVNWSDVQFPEEWKLRDENPPESPEYSCPPRIEFQGGFQPQL